MRAALKRLALVCLALLPTVALYAYSAFGSAGGTSRWQVPFHATDLVLPVFGYSVLLSRMIFVVLGLLFISLIVTRRLHVPMLARFVVPALLVLYVILPFDAKSGSWISPRAIVLISFLIFALTRPVRLKPWHANVVGAVLVAVFLARISLLMAAWAGSAADVRAVRDVLALVPPGSRVLAMSNDVNGSKTKPGHFGRTIGKSAPQTWSSYGAFSVIDRDAYWPGMFAYRGQQPVLNRPPYDQIADIPGQGVTELAMLAPDYRGLVPALTDKMLAGWDINFDYLLLLNFDDEPDLPASLKPRLELAKHKGFALLYKIQQRNG